MPHAERGVASDAGDQVFGQLKVAGGTVKEPAAHDVGVDRRNDVMQFCARDEDQPSAKQRIRDLAIGVVGDLVQPARQAFDEPPAGLKLLVLVVLEVRERLKDRSFPGDVLVSPIP